MKITIVAGARPNFIKIAPIIRAIESKSAAGADVSYRLVHTGQHYDKNLSDTFFTELNIPAPHANLEVRSGSQSVQAAAIMVAFEKDLAENPSDLVLVVGDVNSTMACAIVARKMNVEVAHVEAGIRSGDMTMPEEINRIVTDSITNYFFTTSPSASQNLLKAGADSRHVYFVGNVMIDTLLYNKPRFKQPPFWKSYGLEAGEYIVLTLHRPANVDDPENLRSLILGIDRIAAGMKVVFPVHPRTKAMLESVEVPTQNIRYCDPLGYLEFMYLVQNSFSVITDSGGLSEETTVLGIPCFTMRDTTERPETQEIGTNTLVGTSVAALEKLYSEFLSNPPGKRGIPELWDGKASERIVELLLKKQ